MVGDTPGNAPFPYQEDLDRIYKHVREARRQADIVVVALHDQSHGLGIHPYIDTFAHGVIDAGADIYFCNAGEHRGVEIYKGKALIYGQPGLFLQTEAVTHVPSSYMSRVGADAVMDLLRIFWMSEPKRRRRLESLAPEPQRGRVQEAPQCTCASSTNSSS